ncbi:type VI secretion system-associated FHA domain protein TagH [Motiliproteus sp. MSK22-1]|uniref:type VI secretion system-associated FHA domain protein TagH n=1 Tax=Motiliproteus sp. MSK22-1 TaxID=1897630 RepID=UPI000978CB45|nr:type VI secretion system-associated FHA domain protein TagH [Motiliproteus sp. MSK22-1]OMH38682.1 hypothetical protein BGP75_06475 [Motiliproteus sp. MSK22-1]
MKLLLTIVSFKGQPPSSSDSVTFDQSGGIVGRAKNCDLVLEDPERTISSKHALISHEGGSFRITDTSLNGIYLNSTDQRLSNEGSVVISPGDRFYIGEYILAADIENDAAGLDRNLSGGEPELISEPAVSTPPDITPAPATSTPFESNPFADPAELSPSEELAILDPLSDAKSPFQDAAPAKENGQSGSSDSNEMSIDDILLGGGGNPPAKPLEGGYSESPSTPATEADHIASINQYFVPPNSVPEAPSDTAGNPPDSASTDQGTDVPAQSNAVIPDCWIDSDSLMMPPASASSSDSQPLAPQPLSPKEAAPEPVEAPVSPLPTPKPSTNKAISGSADRPLPASSPKPQPKASANLSADRARTSVDSNIPAAQQDDVAGPNAEPDLDAIRAFLKGAQIEDMKLPPDLEREFFTSMGRLFRLSVAGLVEILRARTDIKSAFRMSMTTIRPIENNPLKFSINTDDALAKLLLNPGGACLPTEQAFNEAFDDIKAHELAVMAGMQAALNDLLKRFEPEELADYFEKRGGKSLLQQKKSWYWDQYIKQHKEILDRAEDQFQELFGEAFTTAYENQTSKLKETRQQ